MYMYMYVCMYVYIYIYILGGNCRLTMLVVSSKRRTRSGSGNDKASKIKAISHRKSQKIQPESTQHR